MNGINIGWNYFLNLIKIKKSFHLFFEQGIITGRKALLLAMRRSEETIDMGIMKYRPAQDNRN